MTWAEVCEEPTLQDLPYKIELNEYGQILMSPAANDHTRRQGRLIVALSRHVPDGEVAPECSVITEKGIKAPDVAWLSAAFLLRHPGAVPYPEAPEICIEVRSPSNSVREMDEKRALYFQQGAKEVWVCDSFGNLKFFEASGEIPASKLCPDFPGHI